MAVKARETLASKQLSLPVMGVFLFIIVGYTLLYNRVINQFDDFQLRTIIGVVSLLLMIGIFIFSLRYTATSFEMTLTHERLIIERKVFFVQKKVAEVWLSQVIELLAESEAKQNDRNRRNFTFLKMDTKKKYIIDYEEKGKNRSIMIQCSGRFYTLLKKQVEIVSS